MRPVDEAARGGADAARPPGVCPTSPLAARLSVVVLTHERRDELLRTLGKLAAEHAAGAIVVVDNGSRDGTEAAVAAHFPAVQRVRLARNLGAAGRNHGVQRVATPYVAFCDDDTWWAPDSLAHAVALLDAYPRLAMVTARAGVRRAAPRRVRKYTPL
jgi:GT2 family glycosyltransferase